MNSKNVASRIATCVTSAALAILATGLSATAAHAVEPLKLDTSIFSVRSKLPVVHMFTGPDNMSHVEMLSLDALKGAYGVGFIDAGAQKVKLGYTADRATLDYHVANHRTLLVILEGTMVFETGDGVQHRVPRGSVVLAEDRTGKGHANRCDAPTGIRQCTILQVTLLDEETGLRPAAK